RSRRHEYRRQRDDAPCRQCVHRQADAAGRPPWRTGRNRGNGAYAVRTAYALHHRPIHPCERRLFVSVKAPTVPITDTLAQFVAGLAYDDLPPPTLKAAERSLVNFVGVVIGGARHDEVEALT